MTEAPHTMTKRHEEGAMLNGVAFRDLLDGYTFPSGLRVERILEEQWPNGFCTIGWRAVLPDGTKIEKATLIEVKRELDQRKEMYAAI